MSFQVEPFYFECSSIVNLQFLMMSVLFSYQFILVVNCHSLVNLGQKQNNPSFRRNKVAKKMDKELLGWVSFCFGSYSPPGTGSILVSTSWHAEGIHGEQWSPGPRWSSSSHGTDRIVPQKKQKKTICTQVCSLNHEKYAVLCNTLSVNTIYVAFLCITRSWGHSLFLPVSRPGRKKKLNTHIKIINIKPSGYHENTPL